VAARVAAPVAPVAPALVARVTALVAAAAEALVALAAEATCCERRVESSAPCDVYALEFLASNILNPRY